MEKDLKKIFEDLNPQMGTDEFKTLKIDRKETILGSPSGGSLYGTIKETHTDADGNVREESVKAMDPRESLASLKEAMARMESDLFSGRGTFEVSDGGDPWEAIEAIKKAIAQTESDIEAKETSAALEEQKDLSIDDWIA